MEEYKLCEFCNKPFRTKGLGGEHFCTCVTVNTENIQFIASATGIYSLDGKRKKKDKETNRWTILCLQK